ncbi:hypothetical protein CF54_07270 [Streptomyces sp. Tu 6176]|nr:hypothetical protein CF54_07270 [Streptomyces sp. Tu 6176]
MRSSAARAARTTGSGVVKLPATAASRVPRTSKNRVSTGPGHSAVTRTPRPRTSSRRAIEKFSTNVFEAL